MSPFFIPTSLPVDSLLPVMLKDVPIVKPERRQNPSGVAQQQRFVSPVSPARMDVIPFRPVAPQEIYYFLFSSE